VYKRPPHLHHPHRNKYASPCPDERSPREVCGEMKKIYESAPPPPPASK
jgi:hypothetical protein